MNKCQVGESGPFYLGALGNLPPLQCLLKQITNKWIFFLFPIYYFILMCSFHYVEITYTTLLQIVNTEFVFSDIVAMVYVHRHLHLQGESKNLFPV